MESVGNAMARHISDVTGAPFAARAQQAVGGGCINTATVLQDGTRRYFVKLNDAARVAMFEAEAEGLTGIAGTQSVRVPQPLCAGRANGSTYPVLQNLHPHR